MTASEAVDMRQHFSKTTGSNTSALPPSDKYGPQAKQLKFLGFTNSEAVYEALDAVGGDINAAIQKLVPKSKPAFDL